MMKKRRNKTNNISKNIKAKANEVKKIVTKNKANKTKAQKNKTKRKVFFIPNCCTQ